MNMQTVISYIVGSLVLYFLIFLCYKPFRWVWRVACHAALGVGALYLCNLALGWCGLFVGVNLVTAIIAGVLGIPGIALLYVVGWIL